MITTSAEFTTAIKGNIRRIRAKVQILWTNYATIDSSITVTSNDDNRGNPLNDIQAADGKTNASYKWAHLDGTLVADGTFHPMPNDSQAATAQMGWYGATRCNGSAQWSAPYPTLTVNSVSEIPVKLLRVCGDQIYNEYPVDFEIKIYNGATLLHTETIVGNTLLEWSKSLEDQAITGATKIELAIKKWSAANRVAKILEFYSIFQEEYTGDDIVSMHHLEEREISDGTLPVGNISANELDIELQNIRSVQSGVVIRDPYAYENSDSFYSNVLKLNRKINAWIGVKLPAGSIEYVKLGSFWSGDWKASEKGGTVSTSARDRMELLRKAQYSECPICTNITAFDLLEIILNHAKTSVSWLSDMTWSIDPELDGSAFVIPLAYFPRQSYFECIRQIAEACMAQAYMSREDVLTITGPSFAGTATGYAITKDDYFDKSQPSKSEELKNLIRIPITALIARTDISEQFRSPAAVNLGIGEEMTLSVEYSNFPVSSAAATLENASSGISIDAEKSEYYACTCSIVVKNNGAIAGSFTLVVTGICYDKKSDQFFDANDAASQTEFGVLKYEYPANHLLQNEVMAEAIAAQLLSVYKIWRKDVLLEWRGNPALELGDLVEVPEYQRFTVDKRANFLVYKNKLTYDGALRVTTDGRKISDA